MAIYEVDECVFRRTDNLNTLIIKKDFMDKNEGLKNLKPGGIIALNSEHDPDSRSEHQDGKITDICVIKDVNAGIATGGETSIEVEWIINDIQAKLIYSLGVREYEVMSKVFSL